MTPVTIGLQALDASAKRLAALTSSMTPDELVAQSYASKWSNADVLSHLGSGAVIMRAGIDGAIGGAPVAEGFNQSVWDEWNEKSPAEQAAGALEADRLLLERLSALSEEEREAFGFSMGPFQLGLAAFLGLRLNEHALHTWDIDVALHPAVTVPADAVDVMIDNLAMVAGFASKSDGNERVIELKTTEPARAFSLTVGPERAVLASSSDAGSSASDVELPAESLVRLVYGRLDPAHTPADIESPALDQLRAIFPGM